MAGAPFGNQNGLKGTRWRDAIDRALKNRSRARQIEALDELAERLLEQCEAGDMTALKELGDRLDGKPGQAIQLGADPDNPLITNVTVEYVEPKDTAAKGV